MGLIGASLGLAAVGVAGLNLATNKGDRHVDAVMSALLMLALWAVTMGANAWIAEWDRRLLNPMVDVAFVYWTLWAIRRKSEGWKLALLGLLVLQAGLHVAFQTAPHTRDVLTRYVIALNVTYIAQLSAIGWSGGRHGWLCLQRHMLLARGSRGVAGHWASHRPQPARTREH